MVPEIAYMTSVKNVGAILDAIKGAGVPPRFTYEFLKSLGFSSSNDRAILKVFKGLGFLDQEGVPTERYRQYRDATKSKQVLAEAMRAGYEDLFLANEKAHQMTQDKLKGFFATKTGKGERVVELMAMTFRAFAQYADFSPLATREAPKMVLPPKNGGEPGKSKEVTHPEPPPRPEPEFHYNIQIHLPATREISVYNAIFKALRENFG